MAGGKDSQEKTEEATPKRLREARKKGQVAKSRDLTTVFVMIIVFITIAFSLGFMASEIKELMYFCFDLLNKDNLTGHDMMQAGKTAVIVLGKVLAPIFIAGVASALFISFLQVGAIFSTEPLKPKIEKLNPVEGFKNMFKIVTFIELIKNVLKLSIVIFLAYYTVNEYLKEILLSSKINVIDTVQITGEIVYTFFIRIMVVFFIIALIDMSVQRWNFLKNMRMSKDEVKREYKQDEGDPQIKGERRRLHREMVFGDVRNNVKKSDAVVSNPTHVAVAIKYDREEMAAPEIMMKGQKQFAELMLQIAREENIPIVRNIPLAWSLLQLEIGEAIPEDLYEPVAEVLSFVYELKDQDQTTNDQQKSDEPPPPSSTFNPF